MTAPEWIRRPVQRIASADWFADMAPRFVPPTDRALNRLTRGRVMLSQWIVPSISLTTTGARTGQRRTTPLAAVPLRGAHYVVASNFGRERHPAWSYNLMANPEAEMTIGGTTRQVHAELLDPEDKERVWPELVAVWPPYDRYVERSGRDLRVFRLEEPD
ncbi:MAG: nitroreductase family deazaflavin-dependent oxidoreductase [Microthrixaceae bacterium]|nr:nitroreductase family deazaflavin-dependent oxidoreductase [Microthrixaceae bacterium]